MEERPDFSIEEFDRSAFDVTATEVYGDDDDGKQEVFFYTYPCLREAARSDVFPVRLETTTAAKGVRSRLREIGAHRKYPPERAEVLLTWRCKDRFRLEERLKKELCGWETYHDRHREKLNIFAKAKETGRLLVVFTDDPWFLVSLGEVRLSLGKLTKKMPEQMRRFRPVN